MLSFNLLLSEVGIDPKDVCLARHKDKRLQGRTIYSVYKSDPKVFELYQRLQSRDCFGKRPILAPFVVTHSGKTLFIGLYSNHGPDVFPVALRECPLSGARVDPSTHFFIASNRIIGLKRRWRK